MPIYEAPLHILLVEDDDGDAKAVKRSFMKAKIINPILRAGDGLEALEMLKGVNGSFGLPTPRIVVADLNMPRMNGIQLLKAIREDEDEAIRNSVVFVLTTSNREEDQLAVSEYKAAGYIVKTTAGQDFIKLMELMQGYGPLAELPK